MRGALHVLATVVLLPYMALAAGFLLLGHSIAGGSLLSLFDRVISHAAWIVPWGIIGAGCAILAIAALGVIPGYQRLGGIVLCTLAAASMIVIVLLPGTLPGPSELLFLSPCLAVLAFGAWLAAT